jgi:iron(II)-dependent oxidoreductase
MPRQQTREYLHDIMQSAHKRTLELIDGLSPEQLIGPKLPILNPILWEIGHIAWFHEQFILRKEHGCKPLLARGDDLYDSIAIAHDTRWDLPLYSLQEMRDYLNAVLDNCLERLQAGLNSERDSYLYQFTTFHEDMHGEAFTWARQTLSYPEPNFSLDLTMGVCKPDPNGSITPLGDAVIPGGYFDFGSSKDDSFYFDNEKWGHKVLVAPFKMAKAPVTNREFLEFVREGGYEKDSLWSDDGLKWRQEVGAKHPIYWKKSGPDAWLSRRFDKWLELPLDQPVIHICWHEANAFCKWAGRRLPTEAEWEFAATMRLSGGGEIIKSRFPWGDADPDPELACLDGYSLSCVPVDFCSRGKNSWGCVHLIGNVWEWTSDTFGPFPGFVPDDYREYSEPLFGSTKVLRGGAWTTRSRYIDGNYRNYFQPYRRDIFAGFRTCALEN